MKKTIYFIASFALITSSFAYAQEGTFADDFGGTYAPGGGTFADEFEGTFSDDYNPPVNYQGQTNYNPYYGGGSNYSGGSGPVIINNNYANVVSYGGAGRSAAPVYYGGGARTYAPYTFGSVGYGGYSSGYSNQLTQGIRVVPSPNEGAPYTSGTVYGPETPMYSQGTGVYTDAYSMNTQPARVYTDSYRMNTSPVPAYHGSHKAWTSNYSEFYSRTKNGIINSEKRDPVVGLHQSDQLALSALPYTGIDNDPILSIVLYVAFAAIVIAGAISLMVRHAKTSFT